jgi:hypothetical protein
MQGHRRAHPHQLEFDALILSSVSNAFSPKMTCHGVCSYMKVIDYSGCPIATAKKERGRLTRIPYQAQNGALHNESVKYDTLCCIPNDQQGVLWTTG